MYSSLLKVILLLVFCMLAAYRGSGQVVGCITPEPTEGEIARRENQLRLLKQRKANARVQASGYTYLPVRFHVVRYSNGTGGVTNLQLNDALSYINADYRQSGIQYYMAGKAPHFINSDAYYDFDFSEESGLADANDLQNAINVYILGSISYQSTSVTGYAYYPSLQSISNRLFVRRDRLNDFRTLAHELGHYFNLLHTFHNNSNPDVSKRELVTRGVGSNCATEGDLVCDTPADPQGLPNSTTSGCSYVGSVRDANGDLYTPSLVNMMGYYYTCGNEFSPGQHERMEDGLLLRTDESNQYYLDYPPYASVPTQLVANQNANGVLVSFQDAGADESGYVIERATSQEGPYTSIKGLDANVTSWLDATVITNTLYYYRVRTSNGVQYSDLDTAKVNLFYCKPSYNSANSPMIIADFLLSNNGTNLISKINTGAGVNSYSDFTATVVQVMAGQSYNFIARAVTGGSGSYFPQHFSIWVDLDKNGLFEATELLFQTTESSYMSPNVAGTISLPAQTASGLTRMRIRSQYYTYGPVTNPCGQLQFGEAEDYTLQVIQNTPPTVQITSLNRTSVCTGDIVQVSFTTSGAFNAGNVFTVQLAKAPEYVYVSVPTTGSTSPLLATIPSSLTAGAGYKVRIVASQAGVNSPEATQTLEMKPRIEAVLSGGGTTTAGQSVPLTVTLTSGAASWGFTLSDGQQFGTFSGSSVSVNVSPATTTTYTLSSVQDEACGSGTGSGSAIVTISTPASIGIQVRVFMEGPYRANTGLMITSLNQRGLLPGQTPIGSSAIPTPSGQPYSGSPWNYTGSEPTGSYPSTTVDWVLVSLRAGSPSVQNTVYKAAALLGNDGWLTFFNSPSLATNTSYYIVIEHRNHLGVMSHVPVAVANGTLSYDFTSQDSYTATTPSSVGQKIIGTIYAMLSCDGNKNMPNQDFIINANDYTLWSSNNGRFDLYSPADFNMDAQIAATDKILWNSNNSKFSYIGRQ